MNENCDSEEKREMLRRMARPETLQTQKKVMTINKSNISMSIIITSKLYFLKY